MGIKHGLFFPKPAKIIFFPQQKRIHDRPNFNVKRDLNAGLQLTLTGIHITALDCDTSFQKSI